MYNFTCVKFCPYGFYADSSGVCVAPCPSSTYGENTTTECLGTCLTGYAQGSLCVAKCDDGLFGENLICKSATQTDWLTNLHTWAAIFIPSWQRNTNLV